MSDPVVSNVRVTVHPLAEPREGLPPCVKIVVHEERAILLIDSEACSADHGLGVRFGIRRGHIEKWDKSLTHPEAPKTPWVPIETLTDDPDEAQAAFERGAEYVRTGVMP